MAQRVSAYEKQRTFFMNADLRVGVIVKTHGIKGEVKVYPTTDSPLRFDELNRVKLKKDDKTIRELDIENVKYFKNMVILKLHGIESIEDAERLRGAELYIPREMGAELKEGEYYIADILDMEVVSDKGERIGVVREVLETGANDVYIVKRHDNGRDLLLPVIDECILDTDIVNNVMTVHIMDGLMDL